MTFLASCCTATLAIFITPASAREQQALKLVRTITIPGVTGRLDHLSLDPGRERLFVAAVTEDAIEVIDLRVGKLISRIGGIHDAQDALYLGGAVDKLYVTSLDGHVRVFQGDTLREIQDFKTGPGPNRLAFDPTSRLVYFGYGGASAGSPNSARVGRIRPARAGGRDQRLEDLIVPSLENSPGWLRSFGPMTLAQPEAVWP